ncbi:hypothetical protein [Fructilactobacillus frigidiflavus]|uniref:hypothetical protein n=1 Tax=Fructilactobacillus frigidiflavus TaxID=3242688 RepID=UPI0037577078
MTKKEIELPVIPDWVAKYLQVMEDGAFDIFPAYDTFMQLTNAMKQAYKDYEQNPEKVKKDFYVSSLKELNDRYIWLFVNVDDVFTAIMYGYEVKDD